MARVDFMSVLGLAWPPVPPVGFSEVREGACWKVASYQGSGWTVLPTVAGERSLGAALGPRSHGSCPAGRKLGAVTLGGRPGLHSHRRFSSALPHVKGSRSSS